MENLFTGSTFNKICEAMDLGHIKENPTSVSGGILHKVFEVNTTTGKYAVKILSPQIVKDDLALSKMIFSEKVAKVVCDNGINSLPAIQVNGNCLLRVEDMYCLIFPWFDGRAVLSNSIDTDKCFIVGELLGKIHNVDFSAITNEIENVVTNDFTDWNIYYEPVKLCNENWKDLFINNISLIKDLQDISLSSLERLSNNLIISHRDLLQKNILWNANDTPMIIDWESAGYINPGLELLDVALYWSGGHKGLPNIQAFNCFIESYIKNAGNINDNINDIVNARFKSKLDWLEYNLKRFFMEECNSKKKIGSQYIEKASISILNYHKIKETIMEYMLYCV